MGQKVHGRAVLLRRLCGSSYEVLHELGKATRKADQGRAGMSCPVNGHQNMRFIAN